MADGIDTVEEGAAGVSGRGLFALHRSAAQWVADQVVDNPIFLRELRRRMRGRALFVAMIAYQAIMCVVAFLVIAIRVFQINRSESLNIMPLMSQMSDELFTWIAVVQGILVLLVGPIITAGIASSEKEKQTLDFLQVTTLRPWAFVFGALASTMLYILLVLMCALPVLSITFLFGGIAPSDIMASFGSLLLMSTALSAAGLYVACMRERTRSAQSALLFVVGIIILYTLFARLIMSSMLVAGGGGSALMPFSRAASTGSINVLGSPITAWVLDLTIALALIAFLALLASRRIFNPENRALCYWQGLTVFALLQVCFAALVWQEPSADLRTLIPLGGLVTWILITISIFIFNTGRVEMGNEVWRLKRRFAPLRMVDESVLFITLLLGVWWFIGQFWMEHVNGRALGGETLRVWHSTFLYVSVVSLFTCALARVFAFLTGTRSASLRWTLITTVGLFGLLPALLILMIKMHQGPDTAEVLRTRLTLLMHVPWVYLSEVAGDSPIIREIRLIGFDYNARTTAPGVFGTLAVLLFALAWSLHRRWWRDADYCVGERPELRISDEPFIRPDIFSMARGK